MADRILLKSFTLDRHVIVFDISLSSWASYMDTGWAAALDANGGIWVTQGDEAHFIGAGHVVEAAIRPPVGGDGAKDAPAEAPVEAAKASIEAPKKKRGRPPKVH